MRKASYSPYSKPKAPIQKKSNYSPFQKQSMSKSSSVSLQSSSSSAPVISGIEIKADAALLFDCDGVIVETEELHRNAYNLAFERFGLTLPSTGNKVVWDIPYYDILQNTIGGGKPKMHYYFNNDAKE
jgi:hypothetical protein